MPKIYCGNLPFTVTDDDLHAQFWKCGVVVRAKVMLDMNTKQSCGFGFVNMQTDEEAQLAIQQLNGFHFKGRQLRVNPATPRV